MGIYGCTVLIHMVSVFSTHSYTSLSAHCLSVYKLSAERKATVDLARHVHQNKVLFGISCATALRRLGVFLRRYPEIKTDVVALIDEWASRFFEELDYVNEGRNATLFAESLRVELPQACHLAGQIKHTHGCRSTRTFQLF